MAAPVTGAEGAGGALRSEVRGSRGGMSPVVAIVKTFSLVPLQGLSGQASDSVLTGCL